MAQTRNKVLFGKIRKWILVEVIKKIQTKLDFSSEFLPLYLNKKDNQLKEIQFLFEQKKRNEILPHEIKAGIESDYLNAVREEEIKKINEKTYWKERKLKQSSKRTVIHRNLKNEELKLEEGRLQEELRKLNLEKETLLHEKEKKYISRPFISKKDFDRTVALIENKFIQKYEILSKRNEQRKSIVSERQLKKCQNYEKKIESLTKKLDKISLKVNPIEELIPEDVILKLDHLSMHFGGLKAVDDLNFEVKKGEIFGLIGPNGAGKTTVFNCITRFYKPTQGKVYYRNKLNEAIFLNNYKVHNVIKEGIVRTFQNVELIWELNVIDNLLVAAHTLYRSSFFGHLINSRLLRQEEEIMRKKAMKILADLDLQNVQYMYPLGLPYGILKKVELARTLMIHPKLIILDEPAAGLNDQETENLAMTIKKIRHDYDTTIFLVEHDMGLVMDVCDTICAISFGKKLAIGTPKEIQNSKVVREAYLGGE